MSKLDLSVNLEMIDKITKPARRAQKSFVGMNGKLDKLQNKLKNTKAAQKSIEVYKKTTQQAGKNRDVINNLNQELKTKGKLTQAQNKKLKVAKELNKQYATSLKSQAQALKKAGVSTKNLKQSEATLQKSQAKSLKQIKKLNDRTKKLTTLRSKLGKFAKMGAIGGGLAIAGIAKLGGVVRNTADELDKMGKAANNLQLPLDQFQALRHQAQLAGVENEVFTKSYQTFNKNLGELKTKKSSLLSTALKDFNPELMDKLKHSENSTEAYEHILVAMEKIPDASKKAALANAVFGRSGKDLLKMLSSSIAGLTASKKELADLGGGATNEDVKAAADFNDAITQMGRAFEAIKFKALTPIMKELTQMFGSFIEKMKDKAWRNDITSKLKTGMQAVMSVVKSVVKIFEILAPILKIIADNFALVVTAITVLKVAMLANPITAIITGIATAGLLIYKNWAGIAKFFSGMWSNIKASWYDGVASVLGSITGLLSNIPNFLLPKSWENDHLENTIKGYREIANLAKDNQKIQSLSSKIDTTATQRIIHNNPQKQPNSTVDVKVKIDSQAPAKVEEVKTTGISTVNLDVGNFATATY